jgi:hypothetical protein
MMGDTMPGRPAVAEDLVARPLAHVRIRNVSGTIILAVGDDTVELSDIAELIWRAMAPGRTVRDIARTVAAAYGTPEAAVLDDVRDFLADLHGRGFVGLRSKGDPARA